MAMREIWNSISKEPFTQRIHRVSHNIQTTSLNCAKLIWVIRWWDQAVIEAVIEAVDLKNRQDLTYSAWPGVGRAGRDLLRWRSHHHPGCGVCSPGPPATNLRHAVRGERLIKVCPSLPIVAFKPSFSTNSPQVFWWVSVGLDSETDCSHWLFKCQKALTLRTVLTWQGRTQYQAGGINVVTDHCL